MILHECTGQRLKLDDGDYLTKLNKEELINFIKSNVRIPVIREKKLKKERKQQTLWKTKMAIIS